MPGNIVIFAHILCFLRVIICNGNPCKLFQTPGKEEKQNLGKASSSPCSDVWSEHSLSAGEPVSPILPWCGASPGLGAGPCWPLRKTNEQAQLSYASQSYNPKYNNL